MESASSSSDEDAEAATTPDHPPVVASSTTPRRLDGVQMLCRYEEHADGTMTGRVVSNDGKHREVSFHFRKMAHSGRVEDVDTGEQYLLIRSSRTRRKRATPSLLDRIGSLVPIAGCPDLTCSVGGSDLGGDDFKRTMLGAFETQDENALALSNACECRSRAIATQPHLARNAYPSCNPQRMRTILQWRPCAG
jgi:hypothetical protein